MLSIQPQENMTVAYQNYRYFVYYQAHYYLHQGDTVCAGVCLFVCEQLYTKSHERILMKFSGNVGGGTRKNQLDFGNYR